MRVQKNNILIIIITLFLLIFFNIPKKNVFRLGKDEFIPGSKPSGILKNDPPCYKMFYYIELYSKKYGIPKRFLYGVAYYETRYMGPTHYSYDHKRISSAGAVGPMQVMVNTANGINKHFKTDKFFLKNNIRFNVKTSAKYINWLYKRYRNWTIVFGCYNTGRPIINGYALNVVNFNYRK